MNMTRLAPLVITLTLLTGCAAHQNTYERNPIDSMMGMSQADQARLEEIARTNITRGDAREVAHYLSLLSKRRALTNEETVQYAEALRKSGRATEAAALLKPLAAAPNASGKVMTEYAASLLENAELTAASEAVNAIIARPDLSAHHAQAGNMLGIIKDASGDYTGAEQAYRSALLTWRGDKSPVLNNLGLNLANQGLYDKSLDTLKQALATATNKDEVARNIDMVQRLRAAATPAPTALN